MNLGGEFLEGEFFQGASVAGKKQDQKIRPKNSGPKFGRPKFVSQNSAPNSGFGGAKSPVQIFFLTKGNIFRTNCNSRNRKGLHVLSAPKILLN